MCEASTKLTQGSPADSDGQNNAGMEGARYSPPLMYVIGRSRDLLQGSGRHKNDDTGSRGFTVDQY